MIVALAALFSMLFLGGVNEVFLIDKIEKGVKKEVVEKDRQKEILAELKGTKKYVGKYNKQRKKQFGTFEKMYKEQGTTKQEFANFFEELDKQRQEIVDKVIDDRVSVQAKIEAAEWDAILGLSGETVDKRQGKANKKVEKKGSPVLFGKTEKAILKAVNDENKQKTLLEGLDELKGTFKEFGNTLISINVRESEVLIRKDATKAMLKNTQSELNVERQKCFQELIDFHELVKSNCDAGEWKSIMKAFTNEMEMTAS